MDWSRIKTIFIVAFLILDVFLLSQFMTKTRQFEIKNDTTIEENLKADGIEYKNLPKEAFNDNYLNANTKKFTKNDLAVLKDQKVSLENGYIIHAELETPIIVKSKEDLEELDHLVQTNIINGDQYGFWNYDEDALTITYYQKVKGKFLFMNQSAHLVFRMNEAGEVISYEQTMLEKIEPINDQEEVLSAIKAIEALYRKGVLKPNSKIVKYELGYYTLVNMEATQVLTPTWNFVVEKDHVRENMMVNAFEGQVIQSQPSSDTSLEEK